MLPAHQRITRRPDFAGVVRHGCRAGRRSLVLYAWAVTPEYTVGRSARAGLVVSRTVGPSVVRNTVSRRLRHVLAGLLADLPPDTHLVVRALPPAATASAAELASDMRSALSRLRLPVRKP